jgi:DNA-binding response OmpR family regulator
MVLRMLCQNANELVRREQLLVSIWGSDDYFMGRSMDVYIAKLRSYLKSDPVVNIINIHGTGFKLEIKN